MENYFPEIGDRQEQLPAIETYRSIGIMTYLDLDYWMGHSELPIEDYHARLRQHVLSSTFHIRADSDCRPVGYATWHESTERPETIEITRQSAPLGGHLELQRSLRGRLKHAKSAISINERSARREQQVW